MKSTKLLLGLCIGFAGGYWVQILMHEDELRHFRKSIEFHEFYRKPSADLETKTLETMKKISSVLDDSASHISRDSILSLLEESHHRHSQCSQLLNYTIDFHEEDSIFVKKTAD